MAEDDFARWQKAVEGSNINPTTLLATDYLNHINEIVMLIEMVPDMPEMLDECREWQPKSYKEHFRDSGFSDTDLAIAAYDHVPDEYRQPFEATIAQINDLVSRTLDELADSVENDDPDKLRVKTDNRLNALRELVQTAISIIHGTAKTMSQGEIDEMIAL